MGNESGWLISHIFVSQMWIIKYPKRGLSQTSYSCNIKHIKLEFLQLKWKKKKSPDYSRT